MRRVKVEVTAEDIAVGIRESNQECACMCPIARALKRVVPDQHRDFGVYKVGTGENAYFVAGFAPVQPMAVLPPEANKFVREFDAGQHVNPLTFEVELP